MTKRKSSAKSSPTKSPGIGRHCLIFGGFGFIGTSFAEYAIEHGLFEQITLADLGIPRRFGYGPKVQAQKCDVRLPIEDQIGALEADWIVNAASIHREPGHSREEYFDTNVKGAENVCAYAERNGIRNILFTSSIAVYGPTPGATDESSPCHPDTPYGASKLVAEKVHLAWANGADDRRLVTFRPGVVYGPADTGNMQRLIHSLQLGLFVLPGDPQIRKSYAYIGGLLDAFAFVMARRERTITCNYVEAETLPLIELIRVIQEEFGLHRRVPRIPSKPLEWIAQGLQIASAGRSPIHPARVRKVSRPTHIVPRWLVEHGFGFPYDFPNSLKHWRKRRPQDFLPAQMTLPRYAQMKAAAFVESALEARSRKA